jgi:hypothetical protein
MIAEFKRDWRRTGMLVVLTIVALVLMIRQFVASEPSEAQAGAEVVADAGAASSPSANASVPNAGLLSPAVWVDPGDGQQVPIPDLSHDPFKVDFKRFPVDPNAARPADPGGQVDPDQARRARQSAIHAEAETLNLQTVLMSNPPRVMINNRIYRVGQQVWAREPDDQPGKPKGSPFLLSAVSPTSVTLEKEDFEIILKLK